MPDYEFQENFSVNIVKNFCALSKHLSGKDISYNDKTISWDGNIIYFSGEKGKKKGEEYCIPVQIKGKKVNHFDDTAIFRILKADLQNYFNNKGVLFLVAEILENGQSHLYAKLLLQIDIMQLLNVHIKKQKIPVYLTPVDNAVMLEDLCVIYVNNFNKQSILTYNHDISNQLTNFFVDPKTVSINASLSSDSKNYSPEIAILRSQISYYYLNKNGFKIPLNMKADSLEIHYEQISTFEIPGIYRDDLLVEVIHKKLFTDIIIQKIIKIHMVVNDNYNTIDIDESTKLQFDMVYKASRFIIHFINSNNMLLNNKSIFDSSVHKEIVLNFDKPDFIEYHKRIILLGDILQELHIAKEFFIVEELLNDSKNLFTLHNLLTQKSYVKVDNTAINKQIGKFTFANHIMFLQAEKDSNGEYVAKDLYAEKWTLKISNTGLRIKVSTCYWFFIEPEYIVNCIIDRKRMLSELENMNNLSDDPQYWKVEAYIIKLLLDYDISKNKQSIDFASGLSKIAMCYSRNSVCSFVNNMQIKKRLSALSDNEKEKLIVIKNGVNHLAACCACVLLEQWDEYTNIYLNLGIEKQKDFISWPIYNLVPEEFK